MFRQRHRPAFPGDKSRPAPISRAVAGRKLSTTTAVLAAAFLTALALMSSADATPRGKPNQIRYAYVAPKDPGYQAIYKQISEGHALEHLQQLLSPLRVPYPLTLKMTGCDGVANAWYSDEVVTVCYELLAELLKNATRELPAGVSKADAAIGPALDIFLHETGHAVFMCCKYQCSADRKMPPISSPPTLCFG